MVEHTCNPAVRRRRQEIGLGYLVRPCLQTIIIVLAHRIIIGVKWDNVYEDNCQVWCAIYSTYKVKLQSLFTLHRVCYMMWKYTAHRYTQSHYSSHVCFLVWAGRFLLLQSAQMLWGPEIFRIPVLPSLFTKVLPTFLLPEGGIWRHRLCSSRPVGE